MLSRIVSLEPSVTATLVDLGQRGRLVGVSRYCHRLVDVAGLPELDTVWSVKADEVVALSPDLVIAATPYQAGRVDELLKARLNVLCLYPQSLADVYAHIHWLGRLCGVSGWAVSLVSQMQMELAELQRQAQGYPRRRVYVEEWPRPFINGAPWIAEIVELLGGEFVPKPAGRKVEEAELIVADPDRRGQGRPATGHRMASVRRWVHLVKRRYGGNHRQIPGGLAPGSAEDLQRAVRSGDSG